jgi:uncharacterized low-complexity protein
MRYLLAVPAASLALAATLALAVSLALAATQSQPLITSAQAAKAMTAQIHRQAAARLRAGYHGETLCSGDGGSEQPFSPATELPRWHCTLKLSGARFPRPCTAVANVLATSDPGRVRIEWLEMSRYCRAPAQ